MFNTSNKKKKGTIILTPKLPKHKGTIIITPKPKGTIILTRKGPTQAVPFKNRGNIG